MRNPVPVSTNAATPTRLFNSAITEKENIDITIKKGEVHPLHPKLKLLAVFFIRELISNRELPQETEEVIRLVANIHKIKI